MNRMTSLSVIGLLLAFCAGCASDPYARCNLGDARATVSDSVDAVGGLKQWRSAGDIHADAVVTLYDEAGAAAVNRHEQVISIHRGRLWASARVPEGSWAATATARGKTRFKADGADLPAELKARLLASLGVMLHRLRGPLNLCGYGETAGEVSEVRVDGQDLIRVAAKGGRGDVKAYYFDAASSMLRFVTAGADAAGGEGTVTVYEYDTPPNGMALPKRLSVVKIGEHALLGDQPVIEVEYRNVRLCRRRLLGL